MTNLPRRALSLALAACLLSPSMAAASPPEVAPPLPDPPPQPPRAFPDPALMKQMKDRRAGGAVLTLSGLASLAVAINLSAYNVRNPGTLDEAAWPVVNGVLLGYGLAGLSVGIPLWTVGAEMRIQLLRLNVGDELVRREVAGDPAYWRARTQAAFGTSIAVAGGGQVVFGVLGMVLLASAIDAGNFDSDQGESALEEFGVSNPRVLLLAPIAQLAAGTALLVTGLDLWTRGRKRGVALRDAAAAAALIPAPTIDPVRGAYGLAWSGAF